MAIARMVALVNPIGAGGEDLTVAERVALGRYPHRGPFRALAAADTDAVEAALQLTGVEGLAYRRLGTLSAGERQLVTLARGLAQQPEILILDEPAAHLDVRHQLALFRILDTVRAAGVAVLAVIHDLPRAASWADRMLVLADGRVAVEGPPAEVLASSACADAFGIEIEGHPVPGSSVPAYTFRERP
jgi:iron complex transport system ATP-binding protein